MARLRLQQELAAAQMQAILRRLRGEAKIAYRGRSGVQLSGARPVGRPQSAIFPGAIGGVVNSPAREKALASAQIPHLDGYLRIKAIWRIRVRQLRRWTIAGLGGVLMKSFDGPLRECFAPGRPAGRSRPQPRPFPTASTDDGTSSRFSSLWRTKCSGEPTSLPRRRLPPRSRLLRRAPPRWRSAVTSRRPGTSATSTTVASRGLKPSIAVKKAVPAKPAATTRLADNKPVATRRPGTPPTARRTLRPRVAGAQTPAAATGQHHLADAGHPALLRSGRQDQLTRASPAARARRMLRPLVRPASPADPLQPRARSAGDAPRAVPASGHRALSNTSPCLRLQNAQAVRPTAPADELAILDSCSGGGGGGGGGGGVAAAAAMPACRRWHRCWRRRWPAAARRNWRGRWRWRWNRRRRRWWNWRRRRWRRRTRWWRWWRR